MKYKLFVDMDGVLADFDRRIEELAGEEIGWNDSWEVVHGHYPDGGFFSSLPPMPDAMDLWDAVKKYDPIVLTATGTSYKTAAWEKMNWVREHLGADVKTIVAEKARWKYVLATPDSILIDDRKRAILPWVKAGGKGILHTSAEDSLRQLHGILRPMK